MKVSRREKRPHWFSKMQAESAPALEDEDEQQDDDDADNQSEGKESSSNAESSPKDADTLTEDGASPPEKKRRRLHEKTFSPTASTTSVADSGFFYG